MLGHYLAAFILVCSLPAHGFDEEHPEKDPLRGEALNAAVKAGDAATLKGLLRPIDRTHNGKFVTNENLGDGSFQPLTNLLSNHRGKPATPCDVVLLEYGIYLPPRDLSGMEDFGLFKEHYPDFTNTLGRSCLSYAAAEGNNPMVAELLRVGVAPKESDLGAAVEHNHAGAVKLLVAAGVSKDSKGFAMGRDGVPVIETARKSMFFAVLDALGAGDRHAADLKPYRENRPGEGAAHYAGRWRFKKFDLSLSLESDGSGFFGVGAGDPVLPILWQIVRRDDQQVLRLESVPGYDAPGAEKLGPYLLPLTETAIIFAGKKGADTGERIAMNSDQSDAFKALAKDTPYSGPTGEWQIDLTGALDDVPAEEREAQRQQFKEMKLTITPEGKAHLGPGPQAVPLTVMAGSAPNELRLIAEGVPPMTAKGSEDWSKVSISPAGEPRSMNFTRKAK